MAIWYSTIHKLSEDLEMTQKEIGGELWDVRKLLEADVSQSQ